VSAPLRLTNTEFLRTVAFCADLPGDALPHIAFAGRSNVGKSSVINSLTRRKNLARISSQPGKTTNLNLFAVEGRAYLVDMPGYGYAKVSGAEKDRWRALMEEYFALPGRIAFGALIVDARHKPTADDVYMAEYFKGCGAPFAVVANKADKLKKSELAGALVLVCNTLGVGEESAVLFSCVSGLGKDQLAARIAKAVE